MNNVVLCGRIVREVELKSVGTGQARVINNTLAIDRPYVDRNGEKLTDFIPFVIWNRQADFMKERCQKGDLIVISGLMQSRSYENQQGQKVYVVECLVDQVSCPSNRRASGTGEFQDKKAEDLPDSSQMQEDIDAVMETMK
ncbi:single-stranded DNA-binding protein [Hutsoniella sourekii]|uniref:single-stranded DNA-binding protein n=1 Tax=Hutsoniella sourekii TaxID=87650 RepID=UPI0004BC2CC8|nr:single-stranded DNA-binding protein [Hutsoniella sourekii]